jgi:predicted nucleotidyltransferase
MKPTITDNVKNAITAIEPGAEIILYGSRARNDYRSTSDWDFLVLIDGPVDVARTDRIRSILYDIELDTGEILSSIVRSRQEWNGPKFLFAPLRRNIVKEGVRL